jgi:Spy/CpxP family protein refolding chaperone
MNMNKGLISMFFGFIVISALALNANAQMCGCMGGSSGGMQGRMMEGMEHQGMGMMHGMVGMNGGGMMMGDDHPIWKQLLGLGLDEKQKEALKALRSKTMKDMAKKTAEKQIAGIELKDLLDKDPVDMKSVEAAVKKSESLKTEMFLAHVKAHEEMKSILTSEQRKRLKEIVEPGHDAGCGMMGGSEHRDNADARAHALGG